MTQFKLISRSGSTIAQSTQRAHLLTLKKSYPGSKIVKVSSMFVTTVQTPTVRRIRATFPTRARFRSSPPPPIRGRISIMPSSWIRGVRYDSLTTELHINMRGKWYGPWYIDPDTYIKFATGRAVPVTTDSRRPPRWGKGIGPSLGAAYHKYIKIGGAVPLGLTLEQQVAQKYKLLAKIA